MLRNPNLGGGIKLPTLSNPGAAGDLLTGKQLIDQDGNILTGSMPSVSHPRPTISVSSSGLITASHTQSAGKVSSGTTTKTQQLTTQAGKTVTPGTSRQTAVSSGRYTTGAVYVAGDSNLAAGNIKDGVSIFGVTGSLKAYTGTSGSLDANAYAEFESSYMSKLTFTFNSMTASFPRGRPSFIYLSIYEAGTQIETGTVVAAGIFNDATEGGDDHYLTRHMLALGYQGFETALIGDYIDVQVVGNDLVLRIDTRSSYGYFFYRGVRYSVTVPTGI